LPRGSPPRAGDLGRNISTRRILLVEDDAATRRALSELLAGAGHEVVAAAHGLEGLSALAGAPFDLALFDLDLPGVDGFELIRLLRSRADASGELPVLALSARCTPELEVRCHAAGFDGFLRKPCAAAELGAAIERIARRAG
jgi:CheY-like chemotaxis protein